jgi:hypothetical protein
MPTIVWFNIPAADPGQARVLRGMEYTIGFKTTYLQKGVTGSGGDPHTLPAAQSEQHEQPVPVISHPTAWITATRHSIPWSPAVVQVISFCTVCPSAVNS